MQGAWKIWNVGRGDSHHMEYLPLVSMGSFWTQVLESHTDIQPAHPCQCSHATAELGSALSSLTHVLLTPQEGKHSVQSQPTVFYMPHCGTALYNNLLWSNWSADALSRVVIIGNSFQGLEER